MAIIHRFISNRILKALNVSPVVFINGPRQSGKSTLLNNLKSQISFQGLPTTYMSMDNTTNLASAINTPSSFLTNKDVGVLIIDEVQLAPELFRPLKVAVDELRLLYTQNANGKYLLTGSANLLAFPKLSEALVGRMSVMTLLPLSTAESISSIGDGLQRLWESNFSNLNHKNLSIIDAIRLSTYPELINKKSGELEIWFEGYLATLFQREIKNVAAIEKIYLLPTLLRLMASRAGGQVNDADLGRSLGLNPVTTKFYRHLLKMLFVSIDIEPWFANIGKRLVKAPKGYIIDTLLLSHLLGIELESSQKTNPHLYGHLVENFIALEISKLLNFSADRAKLMYFRSSDGIEIDFILEKPDGTIMGIEVKASDHVKNEDFKGLRFLQYSLPNKFAKGIVLYSGIEVVPFGDNMWAVPYCILWQ